MTREEELPRFEDWGRTELVRHCRLHLHERIRTLKEIDALTAERDELRKENERLAEWERLHSAAPEGAKAVVQERFELSQQVKPIVDSWKAKVAQVEAERDELKRKVENFEKGLRFAYHDLSEEIADRDAALLEMVEIARETQEVWSDDGTVRLQRHATPADCVQEFKRRRDDE